MAETPVEAPEKQLLVPTPSHTTPSHTATTKNTKDSSPHRRQIKLELSPLVDPEGGEESPSSPSERDVGAGTPGSKVSLTAVPETPV